MVTSSLASNNVSCDVYPINDKKLKSNKPHSSPQVIPNKTTPTNKNKETSKNTSYIIQNTLLNFQKNTDTDICSDKPDSLTLTSFLGLNNYAKSGKCSNRSQNPQNYAYAKESNLQEVGKILQEVLSKAPQQSQGREFVVAEYPKGGTDTGYSSRCSTPPMPLNVVDHVSHNDQKEQPKMASHEPIISIPLEATDIHHPIARSQSPSTCSDSSNGSGHFPKGWHKHQSYSNQRLNTFQPHSQKPFSRPGCFPPFNNEGPESCNQRYGDNNYGYSGRNRGPSNNGGYLSYRKNDRMLLPHGQHYVNSSQTQELAHQNEGRLPYHVNGRHLNQGHYQRMDGRGRNWNGNPKYPSAGRNRPFSNSVYHPQPNFQTTAPHQPNSSNMYYQLNSQYDLRNVVWRFRRTLTDDAGTFCAPPGSHGGRWIKDHHSEATVAPPELLHNSPWDPLSLQVWNLFTKHQQLDSTFRDKMELKERISNVIWNLLPMCRLFVVGSSLSGFGANSSDVDMCLMVTPRDLDQRNEAQAVLRLLQRELNNCGFVEKMELITAKVPILKFRDSQTKIDVDLNCNNSVGIRNTHLLNAYSQLDWRVRPLVLVVKLWAQHHHINNAKDMTISSYSLVLMVIHYLQYGLATPLLPCLHKAYPDKFNSINHVFKMPVTERLPVFVSKNNQTLGELFLGFLEYYTSKFKFIDTAISVRSGGVLPTDACRYVRTKKNDPRMWKYLCIEEPFDLTNTARSVYDEVVFEKVKNVFRESWLQLNHAKDLNQIFSQS